LYDPSGELRSQFKIKAPPPPSDQQRPRPGDPNSIEPVQSATHEQVGQISVDLHRSSKDRKDQNGTKGTKRTQAAKCDGNADGADGAEEDTGRYRVLVVVAPTEPEDPRLPRAGAGKWTVVIRRGVFALNDRPIHCWIQRSADPESLRSGSRQSYFDDRAYEQTRFTAEGDLSEEDAAQTFVQRFGSLNGLATGRTALVVGGYRLGSGLSSSPACARPARYSSAGVLPEEEAGELIDPVPCPDPRAYLSPWPDKRVNASSMSERSRVLPGTIAAGVRSGSLSLVQGTSSAAPFVARRLAERFVDASEMEVDDAATGNYRGLLEKYCAVAAHPAPGSDTLAPHGAPAPSCAQEDSLTRARLGKVRVPLHWQPSVEPHGCQQIVSAADYDSDNDDLLSGDAPP
jgi:hypothetical protein